MIPLLMTALELIPYVGPVTSILGMVTDIVVAPAPGVAMGGMATTIAMTRLLKPHLEKMVEWTDTPYDNIAYDWFTTIFGWVVKISAAMGGRKLNKAEPAKKKKK